MMGFQAANLACVQFSKLFKRSRMYWERNDLGNLNVDKVYQILSTILLHISLSLSVCLFALMKL